VNSGFDPLGVNYDTANCRQICPEVEKF